MANDGGWGEINMYVTIEISVCMGSVRPKCISWILCHSEVWTMAQQRVASWELMNQN